MKAKHHLRAVHLSCMTCDDEPTHLHVVVSCKHFERLPSLQMTQSMLRSTLEIPGGVDRDGLAVDAICVPTQIETAVGGFPSYCTCD